VFAAELLIVRARLASRALSPTDGAAALRGLLSGFSDTRYRAPTHYFLWQTCGVPESRAKAVELYRALLEHSPRVEYRDRLHELTGEEPAALPDPGSLPPAISDDVADLGDILRRLDLEPAPV
jgi:hypothetical protein